MTKQLQKKKKYSKLTQTKSSKLNRCQSCLNELKKKEHPKYFQVSRNHHNMLSKNAMMKPIYYLYTT